MPYIPPPADSAGASLSPGYFPPAASAADADLGDVLFEVLAVINLNYYITAELFAPININYAIAASDLIVGTEIAYAITSTEIMTEVAMAWYSYIQTNTIITLPETKDVLKSISLVTGYAWPIVSSCRLAWSDLTEVMVVVGLSWQATGSEVLVDIGLVWNNEETTPVMVELILLNWDCSVPSLELPVSIEARSGSRLLPSLSSLKISSSRDQQAITATIELADSADWLPFEHGDSITIIAGSDEVILRVVDKNRSRDIEEGWRYSLSLASPSFWLTSPYASPVDEEFSGLAQSVAAGLAGGLLAAWNLPDWALPDGAMIGSGQAPLDLLRALSEAAGGVLFARWDGSLQAEPEYPVALPDWSSSSPIYTIVDASEVFSDEDQEQYAPGYTSYLISNSSAATSTADLQLESVAEDDGSYTLRAWPEPWDDELALVHQGGSWVQLSLVGDESRVITETITILDGAGKTQYPIQAISSSVWGETNLGTITAGSGGTVTSSVSGDSLLTITYTGRCRQWTLRDDREEDVLVVATTSDSAAAGSIAVLVRRGDGGRQGEDVVDSLIGSEECAMARGRTLIDRNCSSRTTVTLAMPFTRLFNHGSLVEVVDIQRGPWRGMLLSQDIDITIGDEEISAVTSLQVEREKEATA